MALIVVPESLKINHSQFLKNKNLCIIYYTKKRTVSLFDTVLWFLQMEAPLAMRGRSWGVSSRSFQGDTGDLEQARGRAQRLHLPTSLVSREGWSQPLDSVKLGA